MNYEANQQAGKHTQKPNSLLDEQIFCIVQSVLQA